MSSFRKKMLLYSTSALLLAASAVFAANGKIAGVIKDAQNAQPLPGANVQLVGTTLGSTTDALGRYFILNVPARSVQPQSYVHRL